MDRREIEGFLKENGADFIGFADAEPFEEWHEECAARFENGMLPARYSRTLEHDPHQYVPGANSLIVLGLRYPALSEVDDPGRCSVAGIAWSREKERDLAARLVQFLEGSGAQARDATGLPAKAASVRAGLATQRKNSLAYFEQGGSAVRIGVVVTDLALEPTLPLESDPCVSCTLCLESCPTGALVDEYVVDVPRCLCYVLEHDSVLPEDMRPAVGNRLIGCETCQLVCPDNREVPRSSLDDVPWLDLLTLAGEVSVRPEKLLSYLRDDLTLPVYSEYTPLRAVALALGNWKDPRGVSYLEALAGSERPEVVDAARWSLERLRE